MVDFVSALRGKKLVVTGGSRGIGEQIVTLARECRANVMFTYNSGNEAAYDIQGRTGASSLPLDLRNPDSIRRFLDECLTHPVDYFIANAGMEFSGDLTKHSPERLREVVDANLVGNMLLLQGLVTRDKLVPGGQISVVGSIAADGNHDQFAYSAAKAGLRGAVESLQYDDLVRSQLLGVKLIEPAFVRTPMTDRILRVIEKRVIPRKGDDVLREWGESGYVMEPRYAAGEILGFTVNPEVTGRVTIPEGADLHEIRSKYLD